MPLIDITGNRYGKLTVIGLAKSGKHTYWECKCDCGKEVTVRGDCLKDGNTKSCGCLNAESKYIVHGQAHSKLYHLYYSILQRCYNPNNEQYFNYGGRGIVMCREWKDDYMAFDKWAKENGYTRGLSIDRINNNGNYEPGNCRWVTQKVQTRNTRHNTHITFRGETKILVEWCEQFGVNMATACNRLKRGLDLEKVFVPTEKGVSTIPKGSTASIDTTPETES